MTFITFSLVVAVICLITLLYLRTFVADEENGWYINKDMGEFILAIGLCIIPFINSIFLCGLIISWLMELYELSRNKLRSYINNLVVEKVESVLEEIEEEKQEKQEKVKRAPVKKVAPKPRKKKS